MNDLLNTCPTCGRQIGACTHTTEGQVTTNSARPESAAAAVPTAPPASATAQGGAVCRTFRAWINSKDPDAQQAQSVVVTLDTTGDIYHALRRAFDAGRAVGTQEAAFRAQVAINTPLGREPQS